MSTDGSERFIHSIAEVDFNESGQPKGLAGIVHDITEQRQAEETLRESEGKYRQLFTTVSDAIILFDAETKEFLDVNEAALKMYGYTRDEFLNLRHNNITAEQEESDKSIKQILADELTRISLRIHRKKDGTLFPVEISSGKLELGNRTVLCGVIRDITERKQTEEELETAIQHLTAHIDNSPLVVVEFDPEFRVIRWSKEVEKIFGWAPEEIIGKSMSEMRWVYDEDEELVRQESAGLFSGARPRSLNVNRNYNKDGSVIHCEWYNSAIYDPHGNLISVQSLVLDVTKRKMAEEALLESEERLKSF